MRPLSAALTLPFTLLAACMNPALQTNLGAGPDLSSTDLAIACPRPDGSDPVSGYWLEDVGSRVTGKRALGPGEYATAVLDGIPFSANSVTFPIADPGGASLIIYSPKTGSIVFSGVPLDKAGTYSRPQATLDYFNASAAGAEYNEFKSWTCCTVTITDPGNPVKGSFSGLLYHGSAPVPPVHESVELTDGSFTIYR